MVGSIRRVVPTILLGMTVGRVVRAATVKDDEVLITFVDGAVLHLEIKYLGVGHDGWEVIKETPLDVAKFGISDAVDAGAISKQEGERLSTELKRSAAIRLQTHRRQEYERLKAEFEPQQ